MTYNILTMSVGDQIYCKIHPDCSETGKQLCTVIFIHPQKRFFMVSYTVHGKEIRECYCPYGPQE